LKKNSRTIAGLAFFVLFLVFILLGSNMLHTNPTLSFLLLSCIFIIGAITLAQHIDRKSHANMFKGYAFSPGISRSPHVTQSKPTALTRTHLHASIFNFLDENRVRCRISRWKNERRAVVEEPLQKALQKARFRTCPKCGSRAAGVCACRYRLRFL